MNKLFEHQKIAVIGLGIEGISVVQYLLKHGAQNISILDRKQRDDFEEDTKNQLAIFENQGVGFHHGEGYLDELSQYDVVIRSPGIKTLDVHLVAFRKSGKLITSATQIFMETVHCPVIGVTGTKGKGTTSTLVYEMLKAYGRDVYIGGNIGMPILDFVDKLTPQSIVVLELSSFQLQDVTKSPHIAVMLMITPEHMDYHESMEEYVNAKRNILAFQTTNDFAIINRDYPASSESDISTDGKLYFVSRERVCENGCYVKEAGVWVSRDRKEEKIIDTNQIRLRGEHNFENVCAASMAAVLAGVPKNIIAEVLRVFTGLPHRLEFVGEFRGVSYYDDSFSTTPGTAIAAIESFTEPLILILGGSSKNADFSELGKVISSKSNIKAIVGIDPEWGRIKEHITNPISKIEYIEGAKSMREMIVQISDIAESGDVVLLSPACASFGMFKNYKDRGDQFKEEVIRQTKDMVS